MKRWIGFVFGMAALALAIVPQAATAALTVPTTITPDAVMGDGLTKLADYMPGIVLFGLVMGLLVAIAKAFQRKPARAVR